MNKIIFCDKNKELVEKVKQVFDESINNTHCKLIVSNKNDVLKTKKNYPDALIVTASNPSFKMNGGLDKVLYDNFTEQCKDAREFKFTKDLFFTISCNNDIQSSREIIKRALLGCYFASRKHDIILTGLGTSIAGLSEDNFIKELKMFVNANFSNTNFGYTDFTYVDFSCANFSNADFKYANFSDVDFSNADFSCANFNDVDFNNANFKYADFTYANFKYADFTYADFKYANFSNADFKYANFSDVDFTYIDFTYIDFYNANFKYADFTYADFSYVDFSDANFSNAIFNYRITPDEGVIIGWKKASHCLVKLEINCKDGISGGLIGRKLRTSKAKVLEIREIVSGKIVKNIESNYDKEFVYKTGDVVEIKNFKRDDKIECAPGIHFLITKDEALRY